MKEKIKREEGQSLIIVGALLIILVALVGMAADVGNAYAQRRIVQNAVDAAALAATEKLAHQEDWLASEDAILYNYEVVEAAENFAERNGVDGSRLSIYYTDAEGNILQDAKAEGFRNAVIYWDELGGRGTFGTTKADGMYVEADRDFDTYLVRVIGINHLQASAEGPAWVLEGPCDGDELFPVTLVDGTFFDEPGGEPVIGKEYAFWDKKSPDNKLAPGNFGWISWDGRCRCERKGNDVPALEQNILNTWCSGRWAVGDWVPGNTGVNLQTVLTQLGMRIDGTLPSTVTIPIYKDWNGRNGSNAEFQIAYFGAFRLTCAYNQKGKGQSVGNCPDTPPAGLGENDKYIIGRFVRKVITPAYTYGCKDAGLNIPALRRPEPTD